MSENKVIALCLGALVILLVFGLAVMVFLAYLTYIFIGVGVFLTLTGILVGVRKWQHSGLPVREARREDKRLD